MVDMVFLIIFCILIYFLPAIVGCKKQNAYSIFLLNLFLGFTVVGWVVALVWAYTKDPEPKTIVINSDSKSTSQKASDASDIIVEKKRGLYKDLESIKSLFDQNIISEEAYNQQRDSLLKKLDQLSNNESAVNTPQQKEQPQRKKRSVVWILILIALLLLASCIYLICYKGLNPFDIHKQDETDIQNKINKTYFGVTSVINGGTSDTKVNEMPFYDFQVNDMEMKLLPIVLQHFSEVNFEAKNIDVYNFIDTNSAQVKYDLIKSLFNDKDSTSDTSHIDMVVKKIAGDWKLDAKKFFGDNMEQSKANKNNKEENELSTYDPRIDNTKLDASSKVINTDNDDKFIDRNLLDDPNQTAWKATKFAEGYANTDSQDGIETMDRYFIFDHKKVYMILNGEVAMVWHETKSHEEYALTVNSTKEGDTISPDFPSLYITYKSGKEINYTCESVSISDVHINDQFLK